MGAKIVILKVMNENKRKGVNNRKGNLNNSK